MGGHLIKKTRIRKKKIMEMNPPNRSNSSWKIKSIKETFGEQVESRWEKTYNDNDENTLIKIIIYVPLYDMFDK